MKNKTNRAGVFWGLNSQSFVSKSFLFHESAHEVKNDCCLFERLFKVKKNGVFFFGISFFVLEIFTFLYYANEGRDDVIDRSTKTVQHSIKNISGNLAPDMYITKEKKWEPSCHCHDNSYAAGPVLIMTKLPRFHLTQGSFTPNNLMGRVKTMWEPSLFRGRPPVPLKKVSNGDICSFHRKRLEPRVLPWRQYNRCHFVSFVMYIPGAKFEEHCFSISRDILDWLLYCFSGTIYDVITSLLCIIQKREYL